MRTLAKAGYSFDLCVYHSPLSAAIDLVRSVPEMAFVLDHLGKPPIRTGDMAPWAAHIRELAALPNVQCKLSGMVTEADPKNWTPEQLRPYIHVALEAFGPERIQFGSDWPVSLLGISYGAWIDIVREAVTDLSSSEQEAFFYGNAARFYRL
jgi:L-fuconolactonase